MDNSRGRLQNHRYLLVFPLLLFILGACGPPASEATPTVLPTFTASPGPTRTATATVTPLPTPTRTEEPTQTPTHAPTQNPTETATPIPTLTRAAPSDLNTDYFLDTWTAEDAARAIDLLLAEPDARVRTERGRDYFQLFRYSAIAISEGILRFPGTFPEALWRWDLAYNLARSGDSQATEIYADIVETALNEGRLEPVDLNEWFAGLEPRATLRAFPIEAMSGSDSTHLVAVHAGGGGFFLLHERQGEYETVPLWSNFDFPNPGTYDFSFADYTGDGEDNLVIYQKTALDNTYAPLPAVFAFSESGPAQLGFEPGAEVPLGMEHEGLWTPVPNSVGGFDLQFSTTVFPLCPVEVTRNFRWNGDLFTHVDAGYELIPDPLLLANCDLILDHALATWGSFTALDLMEPSLSEAATATNSFSLSPEMMDNWRFRLGIYHALAGNFDLAVGYLSQLAAAPISDDGVWAEAAAEFLTVYGSPTEIYAACETTHLCPLDESLALIVQSPPTDQFDEILGWLGEIGIPLRSSGEFDFEEDGDPERWFTVRPEGRSDLDLWMITNSPTGIEIIFLGVIDTVQPSIEILDADSERPVIQMGGLPPFTIERHRVSGDVYFAEFTNFGLFAPARVSLAVAEAQSDLLAGASPQEIVDKLLDLQDSPTFICPYNDCPEFIYTLALAHEMAGNERAAVDLYLELWRSYSRSPYTILAVPKTIPKLNFL